MTLSVEIVETVTELALVKPFISMELHKSVLFCAVYVRYMFPEFQFKIFLDICAQLNKISC